MNCNNKQTNIPCGCCEPVYVFADASDYYTKRETDAKIEEIVISGGGVSSGEVESMIASATSGMASEQWVEDQHYITGVDLSNYALKSEIPTVPTSNTAFTNDAGYITNDALSGYAESTAVTAEISAAVSGKTNESDFSAHTANTNIHVTTAQTASWDAKSNFSGSYNDLTDKPTIPTIWSGTEAQWSQISGGTLDNNTIYLVY